MNGYNCPSCKRDWPENYCPECARTIEPDQRQQQPIRADTSKLEPTESDPEAGDVKPGDAGIGSQPIKLKQRIITGLAVAFVGVATFIIIAVAMLVFGATRKGADGFAMLANGPQNAAPGASDRAFFMATWGCVGGFFAGFLIGFPQKKERLWTGPFAPVALAGFACSTALAGANLALLVFSGHQNGGTFGVACFCAAMGFVFGAMGWFWLLGKMGRI
jgi:hypothetical protein